MRDTARFSPAKAMLAAVQSAGVDLEDREAVDRFLSTHRLPPEVRLPELAAPELPPVELAPLEELQRRPPPRRPCDGCGRWSNGWVRGASSPRPATSPSLTARNWPA
jgi:hypothetical protein